MQLRLIAPLVAAVMLSGCGVMNWLTPYKLDIPQGNEVTADLVGQLKPGMTRAQVRFLLGTPLLTDPFHANRWDYVYSDARGGTLETKKTFAVFFDGDSLTRWEGETLPEAVRAKDGKMLDTRPDADNKNLQSAVEPGSAGGPTQEVKPLLKD
ncbi:outer membrane protein assembly factor BamE [Jeongeupia chitinilytica]|uniref:Outer membrane protein assembly factor BamE n=1 Tax=Jeongeupia chitinilytica TaxID=1041641 RepID=A0ABQ3H4N8_9NEIS|nr:outer membrane protein assembly factor BamE [Jeongeupia chitinilytica]GHD68357.1 outer membrane protein assembly factor BamE [Jeongeupia chitinilytica]